MPLSHNLISEQLGQCMATLRCTTYISQHLSFPSLLDYLHSRPVEYSTVPNGNAKDAALVGNLTGNCIGDIELQKSKLSRADWYQNIIHVGIV